MIKTEADKFELYCKYRLVINPKDVNDELEIAIRGSIDYQLCVVGLHDKPSYSRRKICTFFTKNEKKA